MNKNSVFRISGNDVARRWVWSANGIPGSVQNVDARFSVGERIRASGIDANEISFHRVAVGAADEPDAITAVSGNDIAGVGFGPTDLIPYRKKITQDAVLVIAKGRTTGHIRADKISLNGVKDGNATKHPNAGRHVGRDEIAGILVGPADEISVAGMSEGYARDAVAQRTCTRNICAEEIASHDILPRCQGNFNSMNAVSGDEIAVAPARAADGVLCRVEQPNPTQPIGQGIDPGDVSADKIAL